jgi:hypothetical protein
MRVVLPAPLGPNRPKSSPSWISRSMPARAVRFPYFLVNPCTVIMDEGRYLPAWRAKNGIRAGPWARNGKDRQRSSKDPDLLRPLSGMTATIGAHGHTIRRGGTTGRTGPRRATPIAPTSGPASSEVTFRFLEHPERTDEQQLRAPDWLAAVPLSIP